MSSDGSGAGAEAELRRVSTAVCVAGAWRIWDTAWPRLHKHVVAPLRADVFVVTDAVPAGYKGERPAARASLQKINASIARLGATLRGGLVNSAEDILSPSPVIAESLAMFPSSSYLRKIWQCGNLILGSIRRYDVIIRTRPDILYAATYLITRTAVAVSGTDSTDSADSARLQLKVVQHGGLRATIEFGGREVVIPSLTPWCGNDWLALGSMEAMTVTMDLARFIGPRVAWFSPVTNVQAYINETDACRASEAAHDMLWRRTGTRVHRWPLWAEVGRRGARCRGIIACKPHVSSYSHTLRDHSYGTTFQYPPLTECDGTENDHQRSANPVTHPSLVTSTESSGRFQSACAAAMWPAKTRLPAYTPPLAAATIDLTPTAAKREHEWFPDCEDVLDLASPWPLKPCKFRSPSAADHPVRVLHGYGVPFIPDERLLEAMRRNTSALMASITRASPSAIF